MTSTTIGSSPTTKTAPAPVYYKPPSSSSSFGIQEFLPPKLPLQSIPTNVAGTALKVPQGDWTSPVVDQALRRQINREIEVKTILKTVFVIFLMIFVEKITNINLFILKLFALIRIGFSILKLVKKDNCEDIPMTNKQRRLLGLKEVEEEVL